jgi:hypothetical protein
VKERVKERKREREREREREMCADKSAPHANADGWGRALAGGRGRAHHGVVRG